MNYGMNVSCEAHVRPHLHVYSTYVRQSQFINSVSKRMSLINDRCTTISGHFFAICMRIFHKTEVQTVILRSLRGLNFENMTAGFLLKCQNSLWQTSPELMHFQALKVKILINIRL